MKEWIKVIISGAIFFGVYALLYYIFQKDVDWLMVTTATVVFMFLEAIVIIYNNKKSKK